MKTEPCGDVHSLGTTNASPLETGFQFYLATPQRASFTACPSATMLPGYSTTLSPAFRPTSIQA
jgi:hypothetical protein